ncbi:MAG: metallophosphoesterase [Planctomycetaceae bacterium]|nr:metallophosphoesterase [Planctomycetaceae bacterium]
MKGVMRYFPHFFLTLAFLIHLYVFLSLRRGWRPSPAPWLFFVPAVAFIAMQAARFFWRWRPDHPFVTTLTYYWMGFVIMMALALLFRDALSLVAWITDAVTGLHIGRYLGRNSVRVAVYAGFLFFAYGLYEAWSIRIREVEIVSDRIQPGSPPIRIAFLTDLHFDHSTRLATIQRIVDMTNAQHPDIIIVGGDVVDAQFSPDGPQARILRELNAPAGKFVVVGNHDVYSRLSVFLEFMDGSDLTPLRGSSVHAAGIRIVGVDDPQTPGRRGIIDSLGTDDDGGFTLLVSHRPEVPEAALGRFDLEVSGHTHGGQVWPFSYVSRALFRYPQGLSVLPAPTGRPREESSLYIANGTRFWGPPVRFLRPPDITVFSLRPERETP